MRYFPEYVHYPHLSRIDRIAGISTGSLFQPFSVSCFDTILTVNGYHSQITFKHNVSWVRVIMSKESAFLSLVYIHYTSHNERFDCCCHMSR